MCILLRNTPILQLQHLGRIPLQHNIVRLPVPPQPAIAISMKARAVRWDAYLKAIKHAITNSAMPTIAIMHGADASAHAANSLHCLPVSFYPKHTKALLTSSRLRIALQRDPPVARTPLVAPATASRPLMTCRQTRSLSPAKLAVQPNKGTSKQLVRPSLVLSPLA